MTETLTLISKDFHWEMGHRLPFHTGGCQNIHGHSYRMRVDIDGMLDETGIVMDYFDLKKIIAPIRSICSRQRSIPREHTGAGVEPWHNGTIRELITELTIQSVR